MYLDKCRITSPPPSLRARPSSPADSSRRTPHWPSESQLPPGTPSQSGGWSVSASRASGLPHGLCGLNNLWKFDLKTFIYNHTLGDWLSDQERIQRWVFCTFQWFPVKCDSHWGMDPTVVRSYHHVRLLEDLESLECYRSLKRRKVWLLLCVSMKIRWPVGVQRSV